jgi:YhcH/YjgK/YiaL family protein
MISDSIQNVDRYRTISHEINMAFDFLRSTDFARLEAGRHDLDGDRLYALVQDYETKPPDFGKWETHRNYIDLQFLYSGREDIGVVSRTTLAPLTDYDPSGDFTLYRGHGTFVELMPGGFVLLWPDDAHMPGRTLKSAEPVRKVVVKIKIAKADD